MSATQPRQLYKLSCPNGDTGLLLQILNHPRWKPKDGWDMEQFLKDVAPQLTCIRIELDGYDPLDTVNFTNDLNINRHHSKLFVDKENPRVAYILNPSIEQIQSLNLNVNFSRVDLLEHVPETTSEVQIDNVKLQANPNRSIEAFQTRLRKTKFENLKKPAEGQQQKPSGEMQK